MDQYARQIQATPGAPARDDLEIVSHSSYQDGDWFYVQGEVQNSGSVPAEFVKLVVTYYDAENTVVDTGFSYTELDTVPGGSTSPFKVGTEYRSNFNRYEIQVQGR